MESESKNIIQTLRNVKGMIELSVERKCWSQEELTELKITYHNIYEIIKQLKDDEVTDEPNSLN
jgi:hypothetical protein